MDNLKRRIIMFSLLVCLFTAGFLTFSPVKATPDDDYFLYSSFDPAWSTPLGISGVGGYVAEYGDPDIWGDEDQYLYFLDDVFGRKVRVWLTDYEAANPGGDTSPGVIEPHQHPDNPYAPGPIEPRHFELVSSSEDLSAIIGGSILHTEEFHVDDRGIYLGAYPNGIHKWNHDWNYIGQIAPAPVLGEDDRTETLAYDPDKNIWYAGGRNFAQHTRHVYQLSDTDTDGSFMDETWIVAFTYAALGDHESEHHDGMDFANGYLWLSDMFSDVIAQWYYDETVGVWMEMNRFTYAEAALVEGMGFGPNDHFWCSRSYYRLDESGNLVFEPETSHLYEIGGGVLQQQGPTIPIFVDIKPGSWPNPLNLRSKGVLPIAICGTEDFDVYTIDPATITVSLADTDAEVYPLRWSWEDVATPFTGDPGDGHALGGDGITDLILHYDTQELVHSLDLAFHSFETIPFIITGNLRDEYSGTQIQGGDYVRILAHEGEVRPYSRGHYYSPPFPDYNAPHILKTGTWLTLGFTYLADGRTAEEAEQNLRDRVAGGWTYLSFDGEEIPDAHSYFRWEYLEITYDSPSETYTAYVYYRYYLKPQKAGVYDILWQLYDPFTPTTYEGTGTVAWVSGHKY